MFVGKLQGIVDSRNVNMGSRRLGVDVLVVLVPSADIEVVAAGGTTVLLVAGLDLRISLI